MNSMSRVTTETVPLTVFATMRVAVFLSAAVVLTRFLAPPASRPVGRRRLDLPVRAAPDDPAARRLRERNIRDVSGGDGLIVQADGLTPDPFVMPLHADSRRRRRPAPWMRRGSSSASSGRSERSTPRS
jgi:hypothetical protein